MECAYQLIEKYRYKDLIRIGTSSSDNPDIHVGDAICSLTSSNLSNVTVEEFETYDYIPTSDSELIKMASETVKGNHLRPLVDPTECGGMLYPETDSVPSFFLNPLSAYRSVGDEMEGASFFVTASHYEDVRVMVMITCSDHQIHGDEDTPLALRESKYASIMKVALGVAHKLDEGGK